MPNRIRSLPARVVATLLAILPILASAAAKVVAANPSSTIQVDAMGNDPTPNYLGFALLAIGVALLVIAALKRPKRSERELVEAGPKKAPGAV